MQRIIMKSRLFAPFLHTLPSRRLQQGPEEIQQRLGPGRETGQQVHQTRYTNIPLPLSLSQLSSWHSSCLQLGLGLLLLLLLLLLLGLLYVARLGSIIAFIFLTAAGGVNTGSSRLLLRVGGADFLLLLFFQPSWLGRFSLLLPLGGALFFPPQPFLLFLQSRQNEAEQMGSNGGCRHSLLCLFVRSSNAQWLKQ